VIEGRATARYVRGSAQKAGLVLDLIRGKDVDKAISTLRFARKGVAKDVEKVLRSAVANAQQKDGATDDIDQLYVSECFADQGPMAKRIRAAPMGRAFRILKRTSHLTVAVGQRQEVGAVVERVGDSEGPVVGGGSVEGSGVAKKQTKKVRKTSASKSADA
jgi:large subunit ribosomal protein L22